MGSPSFKLEMLCFLIPSRGNADVAQSVTCSALTNHVLAVSATAHGSQAPKKAKLLFDRGE